MKLFISSDHAGFELKQHLVEYLKGKGIEVVDKGPAEFNHDDDYPDLDFAYAQEVSNDPENAVGN
jgi:ribose 5-phosphate isomerase B